MADNVEWERYSGEYSEQSFWEKLGEFAKAAGRELIEKVLTLYYCLQDPDTPAKAKAVILGALGYFIMPIDLIPDLVPVVGFADDAAMVAAALVIVALHIKEEHKSLAQDRMRIWFG